MNFTKLTPLNCAIQTSVHVIGLVVRFAKHFTHNCNFSAQHCGVLQGGFDWKTANPFQERNLRISTLLWFLQLMFGLVMYVR